MKVETSKKSEETSQTEAKVDEMDVVEPTVSAEITPAEASTSTTSTSDTPVSETTDIKTDAPIDDTVTPIDGQTDTSDTKPTDEEDDIEESQDDPTESPIHYHRISVSDSLDTELIDHFPEAISFIEESIKKGDGSVLVHCREGLSRSPTIIISYLIRKLNMDLASAHQVIIIHPTSLHHQMTRGSTCWRETATSASINRSSDS